MLSKFLLVAILFYTSSIAMADGKKLGQKTVLARVAILPFNSQANQNEFRWMARSLQETTRSSMHQQFEFTNIEVPLRAKNLKAKEIANKFDCDIIVYGTYFYLAGEKQMQIQGNIYRRYSDESIKLVSRSSRLNNQLFKQVNQMARSIVEQLYKHEAEKQLPMTTKTGALPEKMSLRRKKPNEGDNLVRLLSGGVITLTQAADYVESGLALRLDGNYRFSRLSMYAATDFTFLKGRVDSNNTLMASLAMGLSYHLLANRGFRLAPFLLAGGLIASPKTGTPSTQPFIRAGIGFDWLLSRRLALSFAVDGTYVFDKTLTTAFASASMGIGFRL